MDNLHVIWSKAIIKKLFPGCSHTSFRPFLFFPPLFSPMASLGLVTPGAATEGVTPLFFPEKPGDFFFAHRCHYHYRFLLLSHGCHPHTFLPVRPRFSTILCKYAHNNFFPSGVTPLKGVTRGGPPPRPLVTPLQ